LAVLPDYLGRICVAIRVKLLRQYPATLGFARSYALRRRTCARSDVQADELGRLQAGKAEHDDMDSATVKPQLALANAGCVRLCENSKLLTNRIRQFS
jgi:hypothetical protein